MMETSSLNNSIQNQQQTHHFDTSSDPFQVQEPTMIRCKTADFIGNLRRKGQRYFNSDSDDDGGDDDGAKDIDGKKDEETSSNGSEYDEVLVCNVCDRSFRTLRQLIQHQSTKKHFECSVCHQLFQSLFEVKTHKESMAHWTQEDETMVAGIPIEYTILVSMAEGRRGSRTGATAVADVKTNLPESSSSSAASNNSSGSIFPSDERLL